MAADPEVDRLYQLPLAEFTAARNALATARGKAGAEIRALQKPGIAAWAVNQLYWRRRAAYDAVTAAIAARRTAHGRVLSGRTADVDAAEAGLKSAMRAALAEVRALLRESGDAESPATLNAVTETLQSLPGQEAPGRLTRPLTPAGFEALAGLVASAPASAGGVAAAGGAREAAVAARQSAEAARRDANARRRDAAQIEKQTKAARAAERLAEAGFTRARQALSRAERERERLEDQLKFVGKQMQDLVEDLQRHEQALARAAAERTQLERRLVALKR